MGNREQWTVRELIIDPGGGIRAGLRQKVAKVLRFYKCTPAAKVADRYFASAAMHNGAYAVANSGLPGDGLAHNVTCLQTITDAAEDTNGTLLITGYDLDGYLVKETITPNGGATIQGVKAFKKVVSITGSGWAQNGATPDTIEIGFGDVIGLPEILVATADILLVAFNTAIDNAPTMTVSSSSLANNTITEVGDATKQLKIVYQI